MMASKRKRSDASVSDEEEVQKPSQTKVEYQGFTLQVTEEAVPVIGGDVRANDFFNKHVATRRPCVINALPKLGNTGKPPTLTLDEIKQAAGSEMVQVERRFATSETFGKNRTPSRQVEMSLKDFLEKLNTDDGGLLYLSTQQSGGEDQDAFHVPCRQLVERGAIPSKLPWAGNLILNSCNLWMGRSNSTGSSSGLHHDYHDNFYLLIRGRKRFRLYSPDCTPYMYTHGELDKVHFNGRISYIGKETRADGVPLQAGDNSSDDDDDEVVLGKGFDYKSDSDDEADFDETKDDYDELVGEDQEVEERPDSFSKIPVELLADQAALVKQFPKLTDCRECIVELKEGQTLYLPCGWFHEVTSENEANADNHTALNYWYHPPDALDNFDQPYRHSFWSEQQTVSDA